MKMIMIKSFVIDFGTIKWIYNEIIGKNMIIFRWMNLMNELDFFFGKCQRKNSTPTLSLTLSRPFDGQQYPGLPAQKAINSF